MTVIDLVKTGKTLAAALKDVVTTSGVILPGDEGYLASMHRWAPNTEKKSAVVLKATSAQDISAAVLLAQAFKIEIGVTGGGHGTSGAAATHGLLLDLSGLNSTSVDPVKKTVTVGGGCRWEDVDQALIKHGLATVGGRVGNTGVGGLTLGGGVGYLSGKYGVVVDNLLSAKMVLADGRHVTASLTENPDLFWAIRGAGHNFGVATEFTYQAYEIPEKIWCGAVTMSHDQLPSIIDFINKFPSRNDGTASMNLTIAGPPANVAASTLFYHGSGADAEKFFAELLALPQIANTCKECPYTVANTIITPRVPWGVRRLYHGASFLTPLSIDYVKSLLADVLDLASQLPERSPVSNVMFECSDNSQWGRNAPDSMAFAGRSVFNCGLVLAQWHNKADDELCRKWVEKMATKLDKEFESSAAKTTGVDLKAGRIYANYDGLVLPAEKIFGVNLPKLQILKAKYDPKNVFCTSYYIPPPKEANGVA